MWFIVTTSALEKLVVDLHKIVSDWFSGHITEAELSKFEDLLDPRFAMTNPDGTFSTREMVMTMMRDSYARVPGIVITIENFGLVESGGNLAVASYDELQRWPDGASSRRTMALFVADVDSPYGYRWRHAQETWLEKP